MYSHGVSYLGSEQKYEKINKHRKPEFAVGDTIMTKISETLEYDTANAESSIATPYQKHLYKKNTTRLPSVKPVVKKINDHEPKLPVGESIMVTNYETGEYNAEIERMKEHDTDDDTDEGTYIKRERFDTFTNDSDEDPLVKKTKHREPEFAVRGTIEPSIAKPYNKHLYGKNKIRLPRVKPLVKKDDKKNDVKAETNKVDEPYYIVEEIICHRRRAKKLQFQVKWEGYATSDNTWETLENLREARIYIYDYFERCDEHQLLGEVRVYYGDD
ncbi:hypothetical protein CAEBREN_18852 [Caenorhabditis brenneri]|uniref:Chromo domain-containing protein n=1 Tax=Caenorhabditis brenneri TaxID=135651 RepID=G0P423_CAEBE|nr:hypothetical protein CAEBREN_18852 [Caenorhabditis brenneri]